MSQWGNKDLANNVPKFLNTGAANTYFSNTNVYLVDDTRLANATFGNGKAVAHEGWVKITEGSGGRAGRVQAETLVVISNPQITNANSGLPYFPGE